MIQNTSKQTLATQKLCISQLLLLAIGSENDTRSTDSKLKHKNTFNIRHFKILTQVVSYQSYQSHILALHLYLFDFWVLFNNTAINLIPANMCPWTHQWTVKYPELCEQKRLWSPRLRMSEFRTADLSEPTAKGQNFSKSFQLVWRWTCQDVFVLLDSSWTLINTLGATAAALLAVFQRCRVTR